MNTKGTCPPLLPDPSETKRISTKQFSNARANVHQDLRGNQQPHILKEVSDSPIPLSNAEMGFTVSVVNLNPLIEEKEVQALIGGNILGFEQTASSRVIRFGTYEAAKAAVESLNGKSFLGETVLAYINPTNSPDIQLLPEPLYSMGTQSEAKVITETAANFVLTHISRESIHRDDVDNCPTKEIHVAMSESEDHLPIPHKAVSTRDKDLLIEINYVIEDQDSELKEKISQLNTKIDVKTPKKCPLDLFLEMDKERKASAQEIIELQNHYEEFCSFMESLRKAIILKTSSDESYLNIMEKRFKRECSRFKRSLPVYSHRQEILEMIKENQVSILIAETGSGKSTQLVQYLYDSDFLASGTIVCTQPRKVAAMSLAKYVSSEMLETLGKTVGYKTGIRGEYSDKTGILYVTDHTLLNECAVDHRFSKHSCIIVDEAHERNLNTDILLAFIKRSLPLRPDLKVIITSATIDPHYFTEYFGKSCPVKKIYGRIFPVDIMYVPFSSDQNTKGMAKYVVEAVSLVSELHSNEPSGDILVFLTSPGEIDQACKALEKYTKDTAVILPLHGKLQQEDQQKVFQNYPQRKVVFSTNVAETSVTIPGVKYIVDSGLARQLCFDAKKNMNSLEVQAISKSSAEQRKGRAGRISAGKCYRLYSEETYDGMSERMLPEILRVALAGTVLKLFELGITDVLSFDFIEKPEDISLSRAVDTLNFLGAVSGGQLTHIGKVMASFPVNPRLSKVILDGLEEGVGAEAIATVSISTLSGAIFFRGGTDEMKENSDLVKNTFCNPGGDQMTHLSVYCQWLSQCHTDRSAWCVKNSINAKSMRIVHDSVKELHFIVENQCHSHLDVSQISIDKAEKTIPKLFFKAFADNLCAFLGHEKIGYFNPKLPDEKLVVFPGSSLCHLNYFPSLLVFENTLKTSQHFILQALPVNEEWVDEAIQSGKIKLHPTAHDKFKQLKVCEFTVRGLGGHILTQIAKNRLDIQEQATKSNLGGVQFDVNLEYGLLKVFTQQRHHKSWHVYLQKYIEKIKVSLKSFQVEKGVTADGDNVRILLGSGGSVTDILMPNQYCTVIVKGPLESDRLRELEEKLTDCGAIVAHNLGTSKSDCCFVRFKNPKDAEKAKKIVPPPGVSIKPSLPKRQDGLSVSPLSLKIEWSRRERKNFVNIEFNNKSSVESILDQLQDAYVVVGAYPVKFCESKFSPTDTIFVYNVSTGLSEDDVKNELSRSLEQLGYDEESYRVIFSYSKKFESNEEELELYKDRLHDLISTNLGEVEYNLRLLPPKEFHKLYVAYIDFQNLDEGLNTMRVLEHEYASVYSKPFTVNFALSSMIKYSSTIYLVLKSSLQQAISMISDNQLSVKVILDEKHFSITIRADSLTDYITALNKLNLVLLPEVIECDSPVLREYLRSKKCENDMSVIEERTSTVVMRDFRMKCLNIYGAEKDRIEASGEINRILSFSQDGVKYFEIVLKKHGRPPGLLRHLIATYGLDFHLLLNEEGISMARVDLHKHILNLLATDSGYQQLNKTIDDFTLVNTHSVSQTGSSVTEIECCACFTLIDKPQNDMYILEICGHAYHYDCLKHQLGHNVLVFPVECVVEGCSQPFVWKDFENLSSHKKLRLRDLISQSFRSYMDVNQETVCSCPTPDCNMIYTVSSTIKSFLCSHCGVIICTRCHKPIHIGLTCEGGSITSIRSSLTYAMDSKPDLHLTSKRLQEDEDEHKMPVHTRPSSTFETDSRPSLHSISKRLQEDEHKMPVHTRRSFTFETDSRPSLHSISKRQHKDEHKMPVHTRPSFTFETDSRPSLHSISKRLQKDINIHTRTQHSMDPKPDSHVRFRKKPQEDTETRGPTCTII